MPEQATQATFVRTSLVNFASSYTEQAKKRGGIVKYGVEWGEYFASPVMPVCDTVLTKIDSSLLNVYQSAQTKIGRTKDLMDAKWFAKVDSIFRESNSYVEAFYHMGIDQFKSLQKESKEAVSKQQFLTKLQEKLGAFWTKDLVEPAVALYDACFETLQQQKTKVSEGKQSVDNAVAARLEHLKMLGKNWEEQVSNTFMTKVGSPARVFYSSLVQHYVNSEHKEDVNFRQDIETRLGNLWHDSLEHPMEEFLARAQQHDMKSFAAALDFDNDGVITLQDFLGLGTAGVNRITTVTSDFATQKWCGLMQYSADTVDYLVPEESLPVDAKSSETKDKETETKQSKSVEVERDIKSEVTSLTSLKTHVSKRLRNRALKSLRDVRLLSATRVKDIVHVDLIAYAESMIEQASTDVQPQMEKVQEQVILVQDKLSLALTNLQASVVASQAVVLNLSSVKKAKAVVNPRTEFLRNKLRLVIERARVTSAKGTKYILEHDLAALPSEIATLLIQLPQFVRQNTVDAVTASATINALLASIKNVFYWSAMQTQEEKSSDAKSGEEEPTAEADEPIEDADKPAEQVKEADEPVEELVAEEASEAPVEDAFTEPAEE